MITDQPNMSKVEVFKELPLPSKADVKVGDRIIYKAIFICVKLLLDIRLNLVKISEGKKIKTSYRKIKRDNPVIKDKDNIK